MYKLLSSVNTHEVLIITQSSKLFAEIHKLQKFKIVIQC